MNETQTAYTVGRHGKDAEPYDLPMPRTAHVLTFTVDVPPSLNHSHYHVKGGRRVLKPDTVKFIHDAGWKAKAAALAADWEAGDHRLGFALALWFPLPVGKRKVDRDIDNRLKIVIDAIAGALGFNDEVIDEIHVRRAGVSDEPRGEVTLWQL